ncbi:transglycosylase family protein [Streptomyces sp. NPDC051322]|uniref:transglycosylase family protein n=1 Tax=Streptomyces sp. NPDC051322 TaxID=3154645 RepID=UPI00344F0595
MVAAGVTGSAIAIPLLGAGGAHAADATTWDRVALCETGGIWSADLGNGSYGGLQFSQDTWDQYGGGQYASRPDLASRSQQIAVAEKVYAAEGAKPWLSCATVAGLTKDDAATASVDPGVPDTASPTPSDAGQDAPSDAPSDEATDDASASATPSDSTDGSDAGSDASSASPSDAPTAAATDPATDSGSASGSDATGSRRSSDADSPEPTDSPAPTGSASPSGPASAASETPAPSQSATTGKHRGDEANEPSHDARVGDDAGRHASRSESPTRDDARSDDSYTVRPGDNLWAIADAHDLPGGWPALYAANHRTIGGDPDLILPGQALDLSPKQG